MARRVDHASNAAALCPVAIKAYQILRWRGDSTCRITAGLMGALKIDALPGVALSTAEDEEASASLPAATESLGAGASGNFDLVVESGWGALELLATKVGESTTARGVSTGGAVQQKITSADSTKIHLSSRRPGGGFLVHCNHCPLYCTKGQVSLAYWSQFSMVLFRGRVLERWYRPIRDSLAIRRKDLL